MEAKDAERQIQQMVNFILNEAKDKAEEIEAKAMEEFNIEKLKLVQLMKEKIRKEFATKTKKIETQQRIQRSTAINKGRLRQIEEANNVLKQVESDTKKSMADFLSNKDKYKAILTDLILQGCFCLLEDKVNVVCRKEDEQLVKNAATEASKRFTSEIKSHAGADKTVDITVTTDPAINAKIGGVLVTCQGGSIRVDNTLQTRLDQLIEQDKPNIRRLLFPVVA
jgi:V-type H+-transporting ATPase subunit E